MYNKQRQRGSAADDASERGECSGEIAAYLGEETPRQHDAGGDVAARALDESDGFTNREGGPDGPRVLDYESDL